YRLDRWRRGGHHRPFNDAGFPAVRIMETNEHYDRQHQDVRVEDGIEYGDVVDAVDFDYARKLTALNVAVLASLAWAPAPPENVSIEGAVQPSAVLRWTPSLDPIVAGYKVYWRDTTSPTWDRWRWVGRNHEVEMTNPLLARRSPCDDHRKVLAPRRIVRRRRLTRGTRGSIG
ncbi:MAG: hypothetical protein P8Y29_10275, partial [Gemmatimonadota bacterium]